MDSLSHGQGCRICGSLGARLPDTFSLADTFYEQMFICIAVDTFGGWHGAALDILSKLGRQVARQVGKEEEDGVRQLRQRVSVLLTRDNVAMLGSRSPDIPPACIDGDIDIDIFWG